MNLLEDIERAAFDDRFPDTEESVASLADRQEALLRRLDDHRAPVLGLLQRGKDILRDPKSPGTE